MKELHAKTEMAIPNSLLKEEILDDFDDDGEIKEEVLKELDKIRDEMLDGDCISFKSVDELAERYGL